MDSDCDTGTNQGSASNGKRTKAIDAAVQCHENAIDVHHGDCTNVMVANSEPLMDGIVRVFLGMLDGECYLDIFGITSFQLHDLYKNTLAILIVS